MKKNNLITILFLVATCSMKLAMASSDVKESFKKLNWNGIEVNYIEDNRFPTYDMVIYFADGALSDGKSPGETEHAFNLLDSGTSNLTQKTILDQMDFLGTEMDADTTHEYTTLSMSGLSKDLKVAMKDTCNLLRDAKYPMDVVQNELDKEKSSLQALVANHQGLADRANRELTMAGTPYSYPVSGKLLDLNKYSSLSLRNKLDYFLNNVKKRIYITGPKSILEIEKNITNDCKLQGHTNDFVRTSPSKISKKIKNEVVFVPVPDANQVQVRIGRFLNRDEIHERNLDSFASELLGGGFTSRLMREVRVKRGLTYSIGSYISSQKEYGRAGISTFTKNETVNRLIEVIETTLSSIKSKGITSDELERSRSGMKGSHPFKFENNKAFLLQLLYLDHVGLDYSELFDFNNKIDKFTTKEVTAKINEIFDAKKQLIFILGDKSLEKVLAKLPKSYGKLRILNYKDFI